MVSFKGRLWFIQYMPKKPTKWGMKAFVLADAISGYTILYTGNDHDKIAHTCINNESTIIIIILLFTFNFLGKSMSLTENDGGVTQAVVFNLLWGLEKRGHRVTQAVAFNLLWGLEKRGHHVHMDNYYSSPALYKLLLMKCFGACGTVRVNRKGNARQVEVM